MTPALWGLKNCDSCRRARRWLEQHGLEHTFHDLRATPPERSRLSRWLKLAGVTVLVNRRGNTWRVLSPRDRARIESGEALPVLEKYPTLMKRPILEAGARLLVGFDADAYRSLRSGRT